MRALLLSGGIDSAALAYWLKPEVTICFDYGQICADKEREVAAIIAGAIGSRHYSIRADCSQIGSGDLVGKAVSHSVNDPEMSEWWPFRNQLLITLGASVCINIGAQELIFGTVESDKNHKDGTRTFMNLMDAVVRFQEGGLRISVPAITISSKQLVASSGIPKDLLGWTHSCHTSNLACGTCRGCQKHIDTLRSFDLI